jgi:hypothetical protein
MGCGWNCGHWFRQTWAQEPKPCNMVKANTALGEASFHSALLVTNWPVDYLRNTTILVALVVPFLRYLLRPSARLAQP